MVTAEKWYEYEENYRKYGLDLGTETKRRTAPKAKKHVISAKDRKRAMMYVIVLAAVCVGVVISSAYAATLKCEINSIIADNTEIEREIETLTVEIKTANNISAIETRAINELGMVYPTSAEIVYVIEQDKPATDFAMLLKDQAYN